MEGGRGRRLDQGIRQAIGALNGERLTLLLAKPRMACPGPNFADARPFWEHLTGRSQR